jgi:hypothetical protein
VHGRRIVSINIDEFPIIGLQTAWSVTAQYIFLFLHVLLSRSGWRIFMYVPSMLPMLLFVYVAANFRKRYTIKGKNLKTPKPTYSEWERKLLWNGSVITSGWPVYKLLRVFTKSSYDSKKMKWAFPFNYKFMMKLTKIVKTLDFLVSHIKR